MRGGQPDGDAECGGIVYSLDYKARIHQPSTHFYRGATASISGDQPAQPSSGSNSRCYSRWPPQREIVCRIL